MLAHQMVLCQKSLQNKKKTHHIVLAVALLRAIMFIEWVARGTFPPTEYVEIATR